MKISPITEIELKIIELPQQDNDVLDSFDYSKAAQEFFDLFILHGIDSKPIGNQFILARPSISTITNFSLSTSKHLALINISIHTLFSSKTIGAYALSISNKYAFFD